MMTLPDFVQEEVYPTIDAWKQDPPHRPKSSPDVIALPEQHWLLGLIDYLRPESRFPRMAQSVRN